MCNVKAYVYGCVVGLFFSLKTSIMGWACGSSGSALAWHACGPGLILSTTYKERCCVRRELKNIKILSLSLFKKKKKGSVTTYISRI